ncbi:MAG: hypothetical protein CMJ39_05185 [Phycisphaerae bacterium]|nr:hypothetical protein [Phycisphaerae bacterium]
MSDAFRIRSDLKRVDVDGFSFPLGVEATAACPPCQGYAVAWMEGESEGSDTYSYFVAVSHERLKPLVDSLFELLPDQVAGIVEVGSRDAYRAVDVFLSQQVISRESFLEIWQCYEAIFLEDASLAVGVNTSKPFLEIFIDQDKRVTVHVEPEGREAVDRILASHDLVERDEHEIAVPEHQLEGTLVRPILVEDPDLLCDLDQLLLTLRDGWDLMLDEEFDRNLDSAGRELGHTLWFVTALLAAEDPAQIQSACVTAWAVSKSRNELESLIQNKVESTSNWFVIDFYTVDRVAFDDRPESMVDLSPRFTKADILSFEIEEMDDPLGSGGRHV